MKTLKQNYYLLKLNIVAVIVALELLIATPAFAHHPLDGRLPANFFEGLISGFGHPVIGLDHLAFVIASGLIAVSITAGIIIPLAFIFATVLGTVIHLVSIDLPLPEIMIATSVVLFGALLTISNKHKTSNYSLMTVSLAALAGIFHGFAYGEGIFGAEPTPMFAYLIGFITIQLTLALGTYLIANQAIKNISPKYLMRFAGMAIASCGLVFLSSAVLS